MGNKATSLFCSVLFNEFHHRTELMALLFSTFSILRQLGTKNSKTLSPKGTSHTNFDSEWENETFKICKFKGLQILNAVLNYLVCNMMKVFMRPTSASDFFWKVSRKISANF
jgi:hypothetical protein